MIGRYVSPEMAIVFSDAQRYCLWRQVELAVIDAYVAEGVINRDVAQHARAAPTPTVQAVAVFEQEVRHDVVAFLLAWTEHMPKEASAIVHRGLTSSDIVDTALALQVRNASELILKGLDHLFVVLRDHALAHRETARVGRTHGQYATRDVWGHRVADLAFGLHRTRRQFQDAKQDMSVAKLSGPTGTYEHIPPAVEARAADYLGLHPVDAASQVVMRDRLAAWMSTLALSASVCEAVALEVRLGSQSAIAELAEGTSPGQVGSSAMAHKRNPITAEKISGLARVVRSYVTPVMEGVALWHERDISHSSVERVCVPDAAALLEHMVTATVKLVKELRVDTDRMAANLAAAAPGTHAHSALAGLADAGLAWGEAWRIVRDAIDIARDRDVRRFWAEVAAGAANAGVQVSSSLLGEAGHVSAGLDQVFDRLVALRTSYDTVSD